MLPEIRSMFAEAAEEEQGQHAEDESAETVQAEALVVSGILPIDGEKSKQGDAQGLSHLHEEILHGKEHSFRVLSCLLCSQLCDLRQDRIREDAQRGQGKSSTNHQRIDLGVGRGRKFTQKINGDKDQAQQGKGDQHHRLLAPAGRQKVDQGIEDQGNEHHYAHQYSSFRFGQTEEYGDKIQEPAGDDAQGHVIRKIRDEVIFKVGVAEGLTDRRPQRKVGGLTVGLFFYVVTVPTDRLD